MEGDVEGVMRRPVPVSVSAAQGRGSEVDEAEAEKWLVCFVWMDLGNAFGSLR